MINESTRLSKVASMQLSPLPSQSTTTSAIHEINPHLPKTSPRYLETQPPIPTLPPPSSSSQLTKSQLPTDHQAEETATTIPLPPWLEEQLIDSIEPQTFITQIQTTEKEVIINSQNQPTKALALNYHDNSTMRINIELCKNPLTTELEALPVLKAVSQLLQRMAIYFTTPEEIIHRVNVAIAVDRIPEEPGKFKKCSINIAVIPPKKDQSTAPIRLIHKLSVPLDPIKDKKFIEELIDHVIDNHSYLLADLIAYFTDNDITDYLQMPHLKLIAAIQQDLEYIDPIDFIGEIDKPHEAGKKFSSQIQELSRYLDKKREDLKNELIKIANCIFEASLTETEKMMLPKKALENSDFFNYKHLDKLKDILIETSKITFKDFFRKQEEGAEIDEEFKDRTLATLIAKTLLPPKLAT